MLARRRTATAFVELGHEPADHSARCPKRGLELIGGRVAGQGPKHVDERSERDPAAVELDASADEHSRSGSARLLDELVHEPGLSNAGLAADQHRRWLSGGGPLKCIGQHL